MRSKDKPRPSMDDSKMASEEPKQDPLNGISMDESDEDFEPLPSTVEALKLMTQAISRSRSVLVRGPVGCGKSFICQHLAKKNGRTRPPDFVTVQLGEHMDGKALLGTYQCAEIPGEFTWIPGPLTKAMCEGHWILLEDLSCAPPDALSSLVSVLECRTVHLPGRGSVVAHSNFRLFATLRTENGAFRDEKQFILNQNWVTIKLDHFGDEEAQKIIRRRYPALNPIVARLLEAFRAVMSSASDRRCRDVTFRDMLKLCSRVCRFDKFDDPVAIFREASDCLSGHVRKSEERLGSMLRLAENLNVNKEKAQYYFQIHKPSVQMERNALVVGRVSLERRQSSQHFRNECLALTRPTCNLLEKLAVCVHMAEPVLLVGETGCGKTASVQFLARHTGSKLHVVNMSQQSENSDLTGGFKPTDTKHLAKSLKERFVDLFSRTFDMGRNEAFLCHIQTCYNSSRWTDLIELMRHSGKRGLKNKDQALRLEWQTMMQEIERLERITKNCGEGLAFSFIEGVLTKAIKHGDWILLDEINLASPEAIDCLYTLLDSQSRHLVAFDQQSTLEPLQIHPGFRLFACMNPSGDVGKRELPTGIRNRFTEIFVAEPDSVEDLREIVQSYLGELSVEPKQIESVVGLYLTLKRPDPTASSWPCYSLRTLCRALAYARRNPYSNVLRSLYEACCLSFLTELDLVSYKKVEALVKEFLIGKESNAITRFLNQPLAPPTEPGEFTKVEGYWLKRGKLDTALDDRYYLTPTVRRNLRDLSRAVAARNYPILLQGETSVGKTSLIMHLAKLTGNKCIRINNHEHTDIQEYVGTYATDENNKLVHVEGPLVQAMRNGDWIILDELNLSPPDILEALNRVLDDNRELFIAETQETVRAHPDFILFATQNPAGIYGGRKMLSRAFRYRFVELRFNELPSDELETILQHRCALPPSYAKKMVNVMRSLQIYRSTSGVFVGRESYMTLRDLFRWGERYRLATAGKDRFEDWDQYLADQGYLLLGCRARREEDEVVIRDVLRKHFARTVEPEKLFAIGSPYFLIDTTRVMSGFEHLVWTLEARRLAVLIGQALKYGEPLLLVGETGCGKTTLCQLFAELQQKALRVINCHMMTEAADFLGRLAPASVDKRELGLLFEWRDGPLVSAMRTGCPILIDEISLADDSVLERLNSVLEPERMLLLAEKGSNSEGFNEMVYAIDGFALMATMNPGGDYGKKELSRALRNRFTEIWCRNVFNSEDFVRIVEHNIRSDITLGSGDHGESGFGKAILHFVSWFAQNCPMEYARFISLRDVMEWVKFVNRCSSDKLEPWLAFLHGAMVTFIDGLGGNKSTVHRTTLESFRDKCMQFLIREVVPSMATVSRPELASGSGRLVSTDSSWGLDPFFIGLGDNTRQVDQRYSFETPVCRKNLFKLLRAMQLEKPVLLEGSPGVGKTSLVSALAKATGHRLTRINLSEQTDLSDLFGCDLPVSTPDGQQAFDWVDGSFLAALKDGHWILIDEMNLASQSVLEGLNACFDHRGEIYVPEIDRTFKVDKTNTRFFACQNPYSQGGNRKGLPKSFLNRFSSVIVESLGIEDQETILSNLFPDIDVKVLKKMIEFNEKVNEAVCINRIWGQYGSPWEFNLRDLMRWCELLVDSNLDRNSASFVDLVYASRFRSMDDRQQLWAICDSVFGAGTRFEASLQFSISPELLQVGDAVLERRTKDTLNTDDANDLLICRSMLKPLRYLMHCVKRRQLAILVGKSAVGKTCLVKALAALSGHRLRTVYLTSDSDSSELLGSFEQTVDDTHMKRIKRDLRKCCHGNKLALVLVRKFDGTSQFFDQIEDVLKKEPGTESESVRRVRELKVEWIEQAERGKKLRFSWIDSPLVEALRDGDWILLENVNYCSPAVLDRLNALLEPDGELAVSERGFVDGKIPVYQPHENFRIFYTMDPTHGPISRAMRNRGVEICVLDEESWAYDPIDIVHVLTKQTGDMPISKLLAEEFLRKDSDNSAFRIRILLQKAFEASRDVETLLDPSRRRSTSTTAMNLLGDPQFEGLVPIDLAKTDPLIVGVARDAVYMVQSARTATNQRQPLAALRQFLLRSSSEDVSIRISVVNWMLASGLLYNTGFDKFWANVPFSIPRYGQQMFSTPLKSGRITGDFRWNWELARALMGWHSVPDEVRSLLDRRFLAVNTKWVLAASVANHVPESLLALAKGAVEGRLREVSPPIPQVAVLLERLAVFCNGILDGSEWACCLDEQLVSIILRLQLFAAAVCEKRIDLISDMDAVRLYWIWFFDVLNMLLANASSPNSQSMAEVCEFLNHHWSSEKLDWKIYTSIRNRLTGTDYVSQTETEVLLKSFLARSILGLHSAMTKSIVDDRPDVEAESRQLELSVSEIAISGDSTRMQWLEEQINQLNCRLCDDGNGTTHVFSRRDVLMRKTSVLLQMYDLGSSIVGNRFHLPFRAFLDRREASTQGPLAELVGLLEHCLMPLRSDALLQCFGENEQIDLKVIHLTSLPLETTVVTEFLKSNIRNGTVQTAILRVPRFLAEIETFSTYLWRLGSFAGGLERRLRQKMVPLLSSVVVDLQAATEPFVDARQLLDLGRFVQELDFAESQQSTIYYDKCIDFGLAICRLSTPPPNCIDPVVKERTRIEWLREQMQYVDTDLECLNGQYELLTGRPLIADGKPLLEYVHPYVTALLEAKRKIADKLAVLGENRKLYRPRTSQFDIIGRKCREFVEFTQENITAFRCSDLRANEQRTLLARMQNWLRSSESFQKDLVESHSAYTDVTLPFSAGLYLIQYVVSQWSATIWKALALRTNGTQARKITKTVQSALSMSPLSLSPDDFDALPLKEALRFAESSFHQLRSKELKKTLFSAAFDRLLDVWIDRQEEKRLREQESTYEYKPKAPLEVEKQEELGVSILFPLPAMDDNGEIVEMLSKTASDCDDPWFAKMASRLLNEFSASSAALDAFWPLYESCLNFGKQHPAALLDLEEDSTIPAHLLALKHVSKLLSGAGEKNEVINVYKDWNADESAKFQKLLTALIDGAKEVLKEWPDNEALILICERSNAALNYPATSTIMSLAVVLERLLVDAEQWEKVAAKHVKLEPYLHPLRSLLLDWRKMELVSWERLLDDAETEFEASGVVSVLQFGIVWKAWMTRKVSDEDMLKSCGQLLEASPVGEFSTRARFAASLVELYRSVGEWDDARGAVLLKQRNILRYYSEYIAIVLAYAKKQREPIEKELKEFLKIAKFQDLNIWSIRKSSADAHRKLFKLVKQYKEILGAAVMPQLETLPMSPVDTTAVPAAPSTAISPVVSLDIESSMGTEVLTKASSYYARLSNLNAELQKNCGEKSKSILEAIGDLQEMAAETSTFISTAVPYTGTDEEKTKLFKRTLQMRQKSMASLFGSLRDAGLSYRKGAALDEKQLNDSCFMVPVIDEDPATAWSNVCGTVEKAFWASISRRSAFDGARIKPHEQIETQTATRCFGFVQHLTSLLVEVQKKIADGSRSLEELSSVCRGLATLKSDLEDHGGFVDQEEGRKMTMALEQCLANVTLNKENTKRVWRCCPDEAGMRVWDIPDGLANAAPKLCSWTSTNEEYLKAMAVLEGLQSDVAKADEEFRLVKKRIADGASFVSRSDFDKMTSLLNTLMSSLPSIGQLLACCTVDNSDDENFLSAGLLKAKRSLEQLSTIMEALTVDNQRAESNAANRQKMLMSADALVKKVLLATQVAYQIGAGQSDQGMSKADESKSKTAVDDFRTMMDLIMPERNDEIKATLAEFVDDSVRCSGADQLLETVKVVEAFVERHVNAADAQLRSLLASAHSLYGCYGITVDCWTKLMKSGYLEPVPIQQTGDGTGESQFKDIQEGGLGEGEGMNDVSDQITDVGQIEGLKNDARVPEEEKEQRKMDDIEKPIEMDDDFEAPTENINQEETPENEDDEKEDEGEPEMDWKSGEAEEPQEEQLDPGLWEPPAENETEQPPLDDGTKGADKPEESLAAKDDRPYDDREPEEGEQNVKQDAQEPEDDEQAEEQDFDLENVNLDDKDDQANQDQEDRASDSEGEGEIEDEVLGEDQPADLVEDEETPEETRTDKSQAAEKAFSSSGANNRAKQEGDVGESEENQEQKTDHNDVTVQEEEKADSGQPNEKKQESAKADHPSGETVQHRQEKTSKRPSPEAMDKATPKRQRLADEEKTMGMQDELVKQGVEIENANDEQEQERPERMDESDRVFSHRPDMGAEGVQVIDSASVETALKQSLDTRRALMMMEEESKRKEQDSGKDDRSDDKDQKRKEEQQAAADDTKEKMDDSDERQSQEQSQEMASTIHTVMDFYAHASSFNFDEMLKRDIGRSTAMGDAATIDETKAMWYKYLSVTERLALELTENLRLILEPTVASKLQGDYRSGKRLNIRKLIPYIASQFRKNKIWLRRTKKAKRDYQILLAIDDSSSMKDNMSMELAFESLALLSTALRHLEVGRLGVCKFGDTPELLHSLDDQFVESSGASVMSHLNFEQKKTNVAALLDFVNAYFAQEATSSTARSGESVPAQLLLIVSDGRGIFAEGMERVKAAVQQTLKMNIFTVFIVLDNPAVKHSIMDIKFLPPTTEGQREIRPYLEYFPFPFYVILRQVTALPAIMGDALRQWFEVVVSQP